MKKTFLLSIPCLLSLTAISGCSQNEEGNSVTIEIVSSRTDRIYSPDEVTVTETFNSIESKRQYNTQTLPSIGEVPLLVVPVLIPGYEETDIDGDGESDLAKIHSDINQAFFGEAIDHRESVASYYEKSSYGKLHLKGKVTAWFDPVSDGGLDYEDASDITISETYDLAKAAVDWLKKEGTDLTEYDFDQDGYIDGLWLIYSAPDYQNGGPYTDDYNYWAYTSWGNQSGSSAEKPSVDNPVYNLFGWASYDFMYEGYGTSMVDAHTYIHETGHFLGLQDYYSDKTSYSPIGKVDMMDGNIADHNSYSKMLLGWTKPYIALGNGSIDLSSMEEENACLVIPDDESAVNPSSFDPFSEYLLVELYDNSGLNYLDSRIKLEDRPLAMNEAGVRIYHVDNRKFLLDKTETTYTSKVYEGETVDDEHRIILPLSNSLGPDSYNTYFGVDEEVNLYDEIRLIEASNKDTFTSGGYQTEKTLFKEGSSFSMEEYSSFFLNDAFDGGGSFDGSLTIKEVKV